MAQPSKSKSSTTLVRDGETRTVATADDVVRLKYEGWTVKSEPKSSEKPKTGPNS